MRSLLALLSALLVLAPASPAGATCKCRARGVIAEEGQTLCIRMPGGMRLARCGKVSNVASWTFLDGPCPQAAASQPATFTLAPQSRPSLVSVPRSNGKS